MFDRYEAQTLAHTHLCVCTCVDNIWLTLTPSNRSTIRIVEGGPAIETMPHFSLLPSAMSHVCVLGDYGGTHDGQCVRCIIVYIHIYVLLCSSTVYHYCILNLFSWYLVTFLLAPLDSFLFTCAHLPQPSCHGCEPLHRLLDSEGEKKSVIRCLKPQWHLQSSTEGAVKWEVCACVCVFLQTGYEIVTFAGVFWG